MKRAGIDQVDSSPPVVVLATELEVAEHNGDLRTGDE